MYRGNGGEWRSSTTIDIDMYVLLTLTWCSTTRLAPWGFASTFTTSRFTPLTTLCHFVSLFTPLVTLRRRFHSFPQQSPLCIHTYVRSDRKACPPSVFFLLHTNVDCRIRANPLSTSSPIQPCVRRC